MDLYIQPRILSIGMLYHSLLENKFHRKTMTGLCVNPCVTSLALYLTTSSIFTDENPFRSHKKCVWRSRYYCGKYLSFVKRVQFYLDYFLSFDPVGALMHSAMVLFSGSG